MRLNYSQVRLYIWRSMGWKHVVLTHGVDQNQIHGKLTWLLRDLYCQKCSWMCNKTEIFEAINSLMGCQSFQRQEGVRESCSDFKTNIFSTGYIGSGQRGYLERKDLPEAGIKWRRTVDTRQMYREHNWGQTKEHFLPLGKGHPMPFPCRISDLL